MDYTPEAQTEAPRLAPMDLLAVGGLALLAALAARMPILTPDVWWHLATGRWIAAQGIPHVDPFSYTLAGVEWTAHEWLADRLLFAAYDTAGLLGVVLWRAAWLAAAFALAYRLARQHASTWLSLLVLVPAAYASQRNWLDRPQLWTFALLPLLVLLLERARQGHKRWLWGVPAVLLVWVNAHGGFMLGLAVLLAWLAAAAVAGRLSSRAAGLDLPLGIAAAGALLAVFINPNFAEGVFYPLRYVGTGLATSIQEERIGSLSNAYAWVHLAILVLLLATLAIRWHKVPLEHSVTAGLLSWLSLPRLGGFSMPLAAERHAPLLLLVGGPLLAWQLQALARGSGLGIMGRRLSRRQIAGRPALALWILSGVGTLALAGFGFRLLPRDGSPEARVLSGRFPEVATRWLAEKRLPGNLINPYRWGGYLEFHLWPQYRVWIDSRGDVYGSDRIREAQLLNECAPGKESEIMALLQRYDANVIVWHLLTLDFGPLQVHPFADWLLQSPGWRLVFYDRRNPRGPQHPSGTTAIFVRNVERNRALFEALPPPRLPPLPGPRRRWQTLG